MHFIQAFVLLVLLLTVVGLPGGTLTDDGAPTTSWEVGTVDRRQRGQEAGLRKGDRIVTFDGRAVSDLVRR